MKYRECYSYSVIGVQKFFVNKHDVSLSNEPPNVSQKQEEQWAI